MIPKNDLTTREGIRQYVSTFVYDKSTINEQLLDRLQPLSARWNEMYMAHIREFWREGGLDKKKDMYAIDGSHISNHVDKIAVPTLVIGGRTRIKASMRASSCTSASRTPRCTSSTRPTTSSGLTSRRASTSW